MLEMDLLSKLFAKYGSDKGGNHLKAGDTCHNYGQAYNKIFCDRRDAIRNVFEIGVAHGHSLQAWRDYFPNAEIIGMDNNPACLFRGERIRTFMADQGDPLQLAAVMHLLSDPEFDLMIDDGSHEPQHQIMSAVTLLPFLAPKGLYVIEDIEPDCKPELIGEAVVNLSPEYAWYAIPTGHGLGRAHCQCGCGEGEYLVVFYRGG